MKKFQARLALEQNKLALHLKNLSDYTRDARFSTVHPEEQTLIFEELKAMRDLNRVLSSRLYFHGLLPECYEKD